MKLKYQSQNFQIQFLHKEELLGTFVAGNFWYWWQILKIFGLVFYYFRQWGCVTLQHCCIVFWKLSSNSRIRMQAFSYCFWLVLLVAAFNLAVKLLSAVIMKAQVNFHRLPCSRDVQNTFYSNQVSFVLLNEGKLMQSRMKKKQHVFSMFSKEAELIWKESFCFTLYLDNWYNWKR